MALQSNPVYKKNSFLLKILFATQTGNAEDVANRIAREAKQFGLLSTVIELDKYNVSKMPTEVFLVFVVSTTGQGEAPDNMKNFWKFLLKKNLPKTFLEKMNFALFGLGDSSYQNFNTVAKKLGNRLESLGAKLLFEKGLGDEQNINGYEYQLYFWLERLWECMERKFNLKYLDSQNYFPIQKYKVTLSEKKYIAENIDFKDEFLKALHFSQFKLLGDEKELNGNLKLSTRSFYNSKFPFFGNAISSLRLTSQEHFQDVFNLDIDIAKSDISYLPGDILGIIPFTDWRVIDSFISRLDLPVDCYVEVECRDNILDEKTRMNRKLKLSLKYLIQVVLDITSASPRQFFFKVLEDFATSENERERLSYFASVEGINDLFLYNKCAARNVTEILNDFPSSTPTLDWILECCPKKIPRKFSISSSGNNSEKVSITFASIEYKTPCQRIKKGLCTSWLKNLNLEKDSTIPLWVGKGNFSICLNEENPLLLIATGTGIAPFMSFLRKKYENCISGRQERATIPSYLFYGCRYEKKDYLYKEELKKFKEINILHSIDGLIVAFSRDQNSRIYVTHKLREYADLVFHLIMKQNCFILVSGSAKNMPRDVSSVIENILCEKGHLDIEISKSLVKRLKSGGRYIVEAWS